MLTGPVPRGTGPQSFQEQCAAALHQAVVSLDSKPSLKRQGLEVGKARAIVAGSKSRVSAENNWSEARRRIAISIRTVLRVFRRYTEQILADSVPRVIS